METKRALIVANGRHPDKKLFRQLRAMSSIVISCDGALKYFHRNSFVPDICIGDFDSVSEEFARSTFPQASILRQSRQSDTDLEKAIRYAVQKKYRDIFIAGGSGMREDHFMANTALLLKYHPRLNIQMFSETSVISCLSGESSFRSFRGETISLFGFGDHVAIQTSGLVYPLRGAKFAFGESWSISNSASSPIVKISVRKGKVLLIRERKGYFLSQAIVE